ncbi:MAG TPA: hypothetical protein ENI23_10985, partial [bacterium]|nr:hypothetical protein [bacterium]
MATAFVDLTIEELETREQELSVALEEPIEPESTNIDTLSPSGLALREQDLTESIADDNVFDSSGLGIRISEDEIIRKNILSLSNDNRFANLTFNEMIDWNQQLKDDMTLLNSAQGKIGFAEAFVETRVQEKLPFVGSMYKVKRITDVMIAAQTINTGQVTELKRGLISLSPSPFGREFRRDATEAEKKKALKIVEDWVTELEERQRRGITIGGRIAEGITELPAFMIEFLLTGPLFKSGSATAKVAATKLLGRFAEKGTGKLAVKVAAAGYGTFLRTSVNIPRVLSGAVESMTEGIGITDDGAVAFSDAAERPFRSLALSFADLYIENLTEVAGESLRVGTIAIGKGIGKKFPILGKFTKELAERWIASGQSKGIVRTIGDFLKASATEVGYDGILEEMGEEQLGRIIRSVTGLQEFSKIVPSMEDLLTEAGIFTVPAGFSLAKNKIFRKDTPSKPVEKRKGLVGKELETGVAQPPKGEVLSPINPQTTEQQKVQATETKTKTEDIQARSNQATVEPTGTVDAIRRNVLRTTDAIRRWGTAGQKVARDLEEISARTAKNVGNTSQNVRGILKGLSSKEKVTVSQLTDGAISREGQPERLLVRANALREQLDIMQNEAIDVGLRKAELTGKAFPQIANKKGKKFLEEAETKGAKSSRVFAWAQNQVKDGRFKDVDSAIAALQNYRRTRLRGTEGYLEGRRTIELDLDMREWSPDVLLPGIIEGGWEAIEGSRQWGVTKDGNFKDIRTSIERIRNEIGVDQANLLEDYIKAQYGQSRASVTAKVWNRRARAVQFVGKLALSPLTITRNMLDRYAKGLTHGTIGTNIRATIKFPPFLNRFLGTSQKIQDEMIRQGAVLGHGHLSEGFASGGAISKFIGQPFALSERGNQTYIAIVKKLQLEADLKRLNEMGGEDGTVGKMYNRMLTLIGQSQQQTRKRVLTDLTNEQLAEALTNKEISDDVMSEVLHRTVTDSAFPLTLASKRMWWGNRPFVQTMTQFKIWSTDQMRFMYKDVLKYTLATGDPSRLARFLIGTWLAGEIYNIARDFLTDKDESLLSTLRDPDGRNVKEISKSIANALVDGGIVGILADLTYGITDWVFGPTVGSIESIARTTIAVKNAPATTIDGLKKFLLDDVPAAKQAQGVLDRIDRTFFDDDNLTENYAKWRQRSFEFRKKKDQLTTVE